MGSSPVYGVPGTLGNTPVIGTAGGIILNSPAAPVAGTVQGIPGAIGSLPMPGMGYNIPGQIIGMAGGTIPAPVAGIAGTIPGTISGAIPPPVSGVSGTASGTLGGAPDGLPMQPIYGNIPYAVSSPALLLSVCTES